MNAHAKSQKASREQELREIIAREEGYLEEQRVAAKEAIEGYKTNRDIIDRLRRQLKEITGKEKPPRTFAEFTERNLQAIVTSLGLPPEVLNCSTRVGDTGNYAGRGPGSSAVRRGLRRAQGSSEQSAASAERRQTRDRTDSALRESEASGSV